MRRFFAPPGSFSANQITLSQEETRHLRDVLRLREGDKLAIFDGEGKEFSCRIESIGKKETLLQVLEEIAAAAPESPLKLTLAVALLKGEKFELVIQKATELGVSAIIPIVTKRCDVKLKDGDKKLARWQKIVLESSKQCGRARLMEIEDPLSFADFLKRGDTTSILLFSERNGDEFSAIKQAETMTALIGPEGGWDDDELELALSKGVQLITLGGRILRAETAAIAIPALLQNHFGDLN